MLNAVCSQDTAGKFSVRDVCANQTGEGLAGAEFVVICGWVVCACVADRTLQEEVFKNQQVWNGLETVFWRNHELEWGGCMLKRVDIIIVYICLWNHQGSVSVLSMSSLLMSSIRCLQYKFSVLPQSSPIGWKGEWHFRGIFWLDPHLTPLMFYAWQSTGQLTESMHTFPKLIFGFRVWFSYAVFRCFAVVGIFYQYTLYVFNLLLNTFLPFLLAPQLLASTKFVPTTWLVYGYYCL